MTRDVPPYPRFGECIAVLAGALDINKAGSDVGRLAREGDFDWEKLDAVIQELLVDGCAPVVGDVAQRIIAPWLASTREAYARIVLEVPLDAVGRSDALPVLIDKFFVPAAAALLQQVHTAMPGPDLKLLLAEGSEPVKSTLKWLDDIVGGPVEKRLYPESTGSDRVEQEKLRKWRSGIDIPSSQSIKLLCKQLDKHCAAAKSCASWLLISSALVRFERSWGGSLRPLIFSHIEGSSPDIQSIESCLSEMVQHAGRTWPDLAAPGRNLWFDLRRTSQKLVGDQDRTWNEIIALEKTAATSDPEGRSAYHYEWMKGRWHALSGQYQEAFPHYEQAFELAGYRAGHQIRDLIVEASCIAAFLGKKPFLKRLKHVGIALGLFRRPVSGDALEDWEFEQFAQQIPMLFPAQGRFPECQNDLTEHHMQGWLSLDIDTLSKTLPDLKTVNRVRAVRFANGAVRRWPQLRLFSSFGLLKQVKALLDAGASVDDLDSSGASALLCALQHSESTGNHSVLDLLLAQPHQAATINSITQRKRLTPLICAIDLGLPEFVEALVEQGADAELRALTDNQSPLYYLVSQLFHKVNPARMLFTLTAKMMEEPDVVLQDTLRRFGVGMSGIFGSNTSGPRSHPELAIAVANAMVEKHISRHTVSNLMRIAAVLLKAGANPNASHKYPVSGRTPLMLAAESDLPELFDLMIQHGGDSLRPDAMGQNCSQIARSFQARHILTYLDRTAL
ncbi:MAG: ankyrin repeat domain-containing protein [Curvibacter sp.]|nr:MAG: ankyrin repeat domain-containing protein [Curvibacter sp.]